LNYGVQGGVQGGGRWVLLFMTHLGLLLKGISNMSEINREPRGERFSGIENYLYGVSSEGCWLGDICWWVGERGRGQKDELETSSIIN
jgi:hypothetical protein